MKREEIHWSANLQADVMAKSLRTWRLVFRGRLHRQELQPKAKKAHRAGWDAGWLISYLNMFRVYLPRQDSPHAWNDDDGRVFGHEELEGSGSNRGDFPLADSWQVVSEVADLLVRVDDEEGGGRDVVQSRGRELDEGVGKHKGWVDSDSLAGQLELPKMGNRTGFSMISKRSLLVWIVVHPFRKT